MAEQLLDVILAIFIAVVSGGGTWLVTWRVKIKSLKKEVEELKKQKQALQREKDNWEGHKMLLFQMIASKINTDKPDGDRPCTWSDAVHKFTRAVSEGRKPTWEIFLEPYP